jgi:potassium uptake Trk family protein
VSKTPEANYSDTGARPYNIQTESENIATDAHENVVANTSSVTRSERPGENSLQKRRSISPRARDAVPDEKFLEPRFELTLENWPQLSSSVTIGRNSNFGGMNSQDCAELGGIEYRSLKLLLEIIIGIYAGLHALGYIGLIPWIINSALEYQQYLASQGQNPIWWAFYSAETMISNCGFTLTPDSMICFRDATWPMVLMTFLAFAGNTCHPIILRLIIWTFRKAVSANSSMQESLRFLLHHPRRCYTLLFPSNTTWILFGILFTLNFIDVLLIIVLDIDNAEVASLPMASRVLAATFQAASSRHTGTSTFNLAKVNPGVQFSLLTMMYISVFPIAMSVRGTNTYEDKLLLLGDTPPILTQRIPSRRHRI